MSLLHKASMDMHVDSLSLKDEPAYFKLVPVRARKMSTAFSVYNSDAPGGRSRGGPGDWLIEGMSGAKWACPDSIFRSIYRSASDVQMVEAPKAAAEPQPPKPLPAPEGLEQ